MALRGGAPELNPAWFETFFDGLALDMWRAAVSPEQTAAEAAFVARALELRAGERVLDVPCGGGRLSIELTRSYGVHCTGLDISRGFIAEARKSSPGGDWLEGDMRRLPWHGHFDAVMCWGNSFAYFDYANCLEFLGGVAGALKPGGRFILDSGAISESILPVLPVERKMKIGDIDFHSTNRYDAIDGRMDITYTFSRGAEREVKPIHQWVHSAAEVRRMLERSGLELTGAYGGIDGSPYELRSPRLLAVSKRILA